MISKIFAFLLILTAFTVILMSINKSPHCLITTSQSAQETVALIKKHANSPTIFFDIDDTIITPCSNTFRFTSPYKGLIDDIKKNRTNINNAEEIIGNWRLQRKTMLVSSEWPTIINQLKEHYNVHALTQIDTGTVGPINSMEQWRYNELAAHMVFFTPFTSHQVPQRLLKHASCYQGIFMTGPHKKSEIIREIMQLSPIKQVILIDDKEAQINDVAHICKDTNTSFIGIIYQEVAHLPGLPDSAIAELQQHYLLTRSQWLEDDAAKVMGLTTKSITT